MTTPETAPVVVGENFTTSVQCAPAPNEAVQGVPPPALAEKSPLAVNPMLIAAAVLLDRVIVVEALEVPTVTFPKFTVAGPIVNGRIAVPTIFKTSGVTVVPFDSATDPSIVPVVEGLKVTVKVQVASGARVVTQPDAL